MESILLYWVKNADLITVILAFLVLPLGYWVIYSFFKKHYGMFEAQPLASRAPAVALARDQTVPAAQVAETLVAETPIHLDEPQLDAPIAESSAEGEADEEEYIDEAQLTKELENLLEEAQNG